MVITLTANYHTHTWRCGHAVGTDAEFAAAAAASGIKTLGFSDHCPYVGFEGDFYSSYRMRPEQLEDYCESIRALANEYRGQMDILTGLETEYYPKLFYSLLEYLRPYKIDYLILGQHYLDDDQYGLWTRWTKTDEQLKQYVDQCCEAMDTGLFSYVAHPDIAGYDRNGPAFEPQMRRLCRHAKSLGMPLEINLLGISSGRDYPCREFFSIAGEEKCTVILGRDAHMAGAFYDSDSEETAMNMVREFSLSVTEEIDTTRLKKYYEKS